MNDMTSTVTQAAAIPETGELPTAVSAPAGDLAYSAEPEEPPDTVPWWRPATLAAAILAAAGLIAGTVYLVFQPMPVADPTALPPATFATRTPVMAEVHPPSDPPPPISEVPSPPPLAPPTVTVTAEPTAEPKAQPLPPPPPVPAPAPADYDQQLINGLRGYGWAIWNPAGLAQQARLACKMLHDGRSFDSVTQQMASQTGMGIGPAVQLTGMATTVYPGCENPG